MYDCLWGTDTIRVVVAGELPREAHNAPLHLFSASPKLVQFAGGTYQRRSEDTSELLEQLFQRFRAEGMTVSYTMKDFRRDYIKEHLHELPPKELAEAVRALPVEMLRALSAEVLPVLPEEEIRQYLERPSAARKAPARKPRRKK